MATIQSPPNSVWPNGLQTDSEGYVNFYSLGTNKVDISTITWPEGTEVKSPFVYEDNKLVGFIDTKALEIDNNDTTIDINYTHFDADLDSIIENTLSINAPENAIVNVKYGAVDKVLTEKIEKVLGKGNCKINFDKATNKVTVAVGLDTTDAQIADVKTLLDRVLPRNLVTEMEWADGLPMSYTRLEYLESTGTQNILIPYTITYSTGLYLKGQLSSAVTETGIRYPFSKAKSNFPCTELGLFAPAWKNSNSWLYSWGKFSGDTRIFSGVDYSLFEIWLNWDSLKFVKMINCRTSAIFSATPSDRWVWGAENENNFEATAQDFNLFNNSKFRIYRASIRQDFNEVTRDFIPALDETGTPCMYDLVTKTPFYNNGTGDFLYPGAEQAVQMTDLDAKSYAKLTEHGVRRLYHVPNGCTVTKDEYAATNGFKELVEPPMPLEGYWMPAWRETDTQLICGWVETEPPTKEVETFNNEN